MVRFVREPLFPDNPNSPDFYYDQDKYKILEVLTKHDQAVSGDVEFNEIDGDVKSWLVRVSLVGNNSKQFFIKKIEIDEQNRKQATRQLMIGLELNHPLIIKYVDNWLVTDTNGESNVSDKVNIKEIYYATEDQGYVSLERLIKDKGHLKRPTGKPSLLRFKLFQKVAFELLSALVVLKQNSVLHRDIKIGNLLVQDYNPRYAQNNGDDDDFDHTKFKLIDFGWARRIVDQASTVKVSTTENTAPEILLRSKNYNNKISNYKYSFGVDIFSAGFALLEFIELQKGFIKTFKQCCGVRKSGNYRFDEMIGPAYLTLFSDKGLKWDDEELSKWRTKNIREVDQNCRIDKGRENDDREKLKRFLLKNVGPHRAKAGFTHKMFAHEYNLAGHFIRNFWFRHLSEDLGWTEENLNNTYDLIMEMINFWPDERKSAEDLLYNHAIFKDVADRQQKFKEKKIDITVKYADEKEFTKFLRDLAGRTSDLSMNVQVLQRFPDENHDIIKIKQINDTIKFAGRDMDKIKNSEEMIRKFGKAYEDSSNASTENKTDVIYVNIRKQVHQEKEDDMKDHVDAEGEQGMVDDLNTSEANEEYLYIDIAKDGQGDIIEDAIFDGPDDKMYEGYMCDESE